MRVAIFALLGGVRCKGVERPLSMNGSDREQGLRVDNDVKADVLDTEDYHDGGWVLKRALITFT